jgi:hypothetical protein
MSPSNSPVRWLQDLLLDVDALPTPREPRPYFSQRSLPAGSGSISSIESTARRINAVVRDLQARNYFANAIGFDCVDGNGDVPNTIPLELEQRIGKPELWGSHFASWSEDDLCDFTEVFFDLVARPSKESFHSWNGCGWHPAAFSVSSGQAIYLWRINTVFGSSSLGLRLAEQGEDRGRIVRSHPTETERLISESLTNTSSMSGDTDHAIALFRNRTANRTEKRSAVVALAGILEHRRSLIQQSRLSSAESALFEIANKFDLRHRNPRQLADYDEVFLDWIFFWYLSTINLTERMLEAQTR